MRGTDEAMKAIGGAAGGERFRWLIDGGEAMSDSGLEEKNRENSDEGFVRERIVKRIPQKRILRKLLVTGVCGVLFGLVAGITMAAVFPVASEWLSPEETSSSITIPKDTQVIQSTEPSGEDVSEQRPESQPESIPGDSEADETTETSETSEGMDEDDITVLVKRMLEAALEDYSVDTSMLKNMSHAISLLGKDYNTAVVTVVMKDVGTDWFENEIETSGECAGIIWNEGSDGSLYILSGGTIPENNTSLQVIFSDGSRRDAVLCGTDSQTGLMVLKVGAEQMDGTIRSKVKVLSLGNSYTVTNGLPVLLIGNLVGEVGATIPPIVTYAESSLTCPDSVYRKMYMECSSLEGTNGFVVSLEGEILGIITPETSGGVTSMIGISDLKGVIELLTNGKQVPYLGIIGQTVTDALQTEYGLPGGVYISEIKADSPVYKAGIKAGDVVVRIGDMDIATIRGVKSVVEGLEPGVEVTVTVKRAGSGGYQELDFVIVPELR